MVASQCWPRRALKVFVANACESEKTAVSVPKFNGGGGVILAGRVRWRGQTPPPPPQLGAGTAD